MLDGINAGVDAIPQTFATEGVTRSFFSMAVSFVDNGIDLFLRKRRFAPQGPVRFELIVRGGVEFDPVGSVVNLLADSLACRPRAVNRLIVPGESDLRRTE